MNHSRYSYILIFSILFLISVFPLGFAAVKNDFVKLVDNTDQCLIDCYSVYEVCSPYSELILNSDTLYFKFKMLEKNKYKMK
jgi:hypothetical protein